MSKKKTPGYWNKDTILDHFYKEKERLGRIPTAREIDNVVCAIKGGRYDPKIRTWNQFLEDIGEKTNRNNWDRDMILSAFYGMKEMLGRVPYSEELGSARIAIVKGQFDSSVHKWSEFLISIGEFDDWDKRSILEYFYRRKEELGRVPNDKEIECKVLLAIEGRKYHRDVSTYDEFLNNISVRESLTIFRWGEDGCEENRRRILGAFYGMKEMLGRVPAVEDIDSSITNAISRGKYNPKIRTWNGFLESLGEKINRRFIREQDSVGVLEALLEGTQ